MISNNLTWQYQPESGGRDSGSRSYRGYDTSRKLQQLRPDRPVKLELQAGDLLTLNNDDGGSTVFLLTFNERGHADFDAIGLQENPVTPCDITKPGWQQIANWFKNQGGRLPPAPATGNELDAVQIFDADSPIADAYIVRARADVTLWMLLDPHLTYDARHVHFGGMGGSISYEHKRGGKPANPLPDPFGNVREEFTIPRGTALSYEVKAGEVLQIIDVEGQQCSDFMAMNAHALEHNLERYIDSTVTRSMIRSAYPAPGLFDKFFDQDMRPLLKVKQDTVGRHDTFAFACTGRGYEERGFFGHLNCSDNISHAYQRFGIKPRAAWPAINFFFNSWIDHRDNMIQSDEAWSRPGDYVAMEAMTDLVAVSTACPDDVDPINGWNPTDIHVRIYRQNTPVQYAVAYRSEPGSESILTEQSAFHERTKALTEHFGVARDVWLPRTYEATRAIEEYQACRNAVTIQDMSSLRKFDVLGPDAGKLLQQALTRDINKLSINRGVYALMCDDTGVVIDDGTLFRLSHDTFRWCCGSDDSGLQLKELAQAQGLNVWIKSLFSTLPNLAIQGPKSYKLIERICFIQPTASSVKQLRWFGSTIARLYDREGEPFHLTRTGYTGELGYEIFCHPDSALPLWDALIKEGDAFGIKPMGLDALETIRIEAGLMAAGAEFSADVDAFEAGLGFAVDLKKSDFVGKAALERNQNQTRRVLKGLRFKGHEAPIHGDAVMSGRRQIGVITSATVSPMFDCAIAMARLAVEHGEVGKILEVGKLEGHSKRLQAEVCDTPFFDPTRSRARAWKH